MKALSDLIKDSTSAFLSGGGGGSGVSGTVTITVPGGVRNYGSIEHTQTVSAPGVTPAMRLVMGLAPVTDADENDPELLSPIAIVGKAGTDQIEVFASFSVPASGPIILTYVGA